MINKTFYTSESKKLKKYLELIFKNSRITTDLKDNVQIQEALEESLNIMNTFEIQTKSKKNIALEYVEKYNTAANKKISLRELDYKEEYEYVDQINWLVIYCKNQYRIDLMNDSSVVSSGNEIIEQSPEQQKREKIINEAIGSDVDASKIIELNNRMISSSKHLTEDIANGKVYIYKSKPTIMPIINLLFMYSFALLALSALLTSIMFFVTSGMNINTFDTTNTAVFSWPNGLVLFIFSGFMANTSVRSFLVWYKKKSDNAKYYMNWNNNLLVLIFLFICLLMIIINVTNMSTDNYWVSCYYIFFQVLKVGADAGAVWTLSISLSCTLFFFLTTLILMVIGIAKNPKRDDKRIEDLYKDYLSREPVKLD